MAKTQSVNDAFQIRPKPNSGLFEIKPAKELGSIPNKLLGTYTSMREAKVAIDTFRRVNFTSQHRTRVSNAKKRVLTPLKDVNAKRNKAGESKVDASTGNYKASK